MLLLKDFRTYLFDFGNWPLKVPMTRLRPKNVSDLLEASMIKTELVDVANQKEF